MMAVNFRNRIEDISEKLAGNYEGGILYQKGDYESPEFIRLSLGSNENKCLFRRINSGIFPGFIKSSFDTKLCVLSTWATFYYDLKFENCE
jgi:hypothetical protein